MSNRSRYEILESIASGGMATVSFGRLRGDEGFARTVALKQLHPAYANDPTFVKGFLEEARLVARIRHPNVVPTLDLVREGQTLVVVLEYVHGVSLAYVQEKLRRPLPVDMAVTIVSHALHGLHAAHEATDETGQPLDIIHRDVSPQNILVGADGVARLLDFGIAKAASSSQTTEGVVKGKLAYMAPERFNADLVAQRAVDRRVDVWAAGVVLWEALTGARLFASPSPSATIARITVGNVPPPSRMAAGVPPALDAVVMKALSRVREDRFATAREMATALEAIVPPESATNVAAWLRATCGPRLEELAEALERVERSERHPRTEAASARGEAMPREATLRMAFGPASTNQLSSTHPRTWPWIALGLATAALLGGLAGYAARHRSRQAAAPALRAHTSASPLAPASATSAP